MCPHKPPCPIADAADRMPDEPNRYTRPAQSWFLASQLVHPLRDYSIVNLGDLMHEVGAQ